MLEAIRDNQFNEEVIKFFELGRSFEAQTNSKLPKETNWLCLGSNTGYYDLKGILVNLLAKFYVNEDDFVVKKTTAEFFKNGVSADIFIQGKRLVSLGEIKEGVRDKYGIKREVTIALVNIDLLLALDIPVTKFVQFSKYQKVTRDVSVVFPSSVTIFEIKQKLSRISNLVVGIDIIDIYTGKNLGVDQKSVTIRFVIQSADCTLTDNEVDELMKIVHNKITEIGGKLRGGR